MKRMNDKALVEGTAVQIRDKDDVLSLEYDGALTVHKSSLWWGTAVGFRAMQVAANALSQDDKLWARDNLYIVSGHPGPGVRDSIDYITRCPERGNYTVMQKPGCDMACNSDMLFEWWVSDGDATVEIKLRPDFISDEFYELSDRLFAKPTKEDLKRFDIFKVNLSTRIWNGRLDDNFSVTHLDTPLKPGELPEHELNPSTEA